MKRLGVSLFAPSFLATIEFLGHDILPGSLNAATPTPPLPATLQVLAAAQAIRPAGIAHAERGHPLNAVR